jgi:hypothetical protein
MKNQVFTKKEIKLIRKALLNQKKGSDEEQTYYSILDKLDKIHPLPAEIIMKK